MSLRSRFNSQWAALIAWLRPSVKATPPAVTLPSQAKPTAVAARPVTAPADRAFTDGAAKAREREVETV